MGPPATDLPPEGRPADKASDVEDIYQTAGELAARGAFDEASARLLDWLRRHDRDAKAYDLLADVEKAAGRATRAILACLDLPARAPPTGPPVPEENEFTAQPEADFSFADSFTD